MTGAEHMTVMRRTGAALVLLAAALPVVAAGQTPDLAALADSVRVEATAPALGLALIRPGAAPEIAVAGVRCADSTAAVTASDAWHWGSVTKSMTATLVARLVEEGAVSWDQTVGELLGDSVPDTRDPYRDATFLHLLSHRAGLQPNIPPYRAMRFGQTSDDPVADRLAWARIALSQEPVGPLEEAFDYSNSGYVVAGAMLEAATGDPWEVLVRREVFEPLGIRDAGFGAPNAGSVGAQPCGHIPGPEADQPVRLNGDNPVPLGPAGRVHMPLADMARYLSAHATRRSDFLGAESWRRLHTPPFGGEYALGWVIPEPGQWWHNGSNTMWYAEVTFDAEGRAAAVVVNDGELPVVRPVVGELLGRLMQTGRMPDRD